jgi:DNA-directed RNA polymerase sigma subunit (sigma70/sigma32)
MPLEMPNRTLSYFIDFIRTTHRLKPKEADVLILRLKRKKLKTIGRKYRLSYERIRQIEKVSLNKLDTDSYQETLF